MDWPAGKSRMRRGKPVSVHLRIALDGGNDARGLLGESVTRGVDEITSDIHQCATAGFDLVADIGGIVVEVTEDANHGAQFSNAAFSRAIRGGEAIAGNCES